MIRDLHCPVSDIVHPLYPQHLILCLELFSGALTLGHLLDQSIHKIDRFRIGVDQVLGQCALQFSVNARISET